MAKRVLDVGNCFADHTSLRSLMEEHFDVEVVRVHGWNDAIAELKAAPADLVLVNRKLDRDGSDGLEVIRQIKADPQFAGTPCMLITNYADHQQRAVQAGAERGFGKAELHDPETVEKLRRFLE